jgi:hypothetical protein
MIDRKLDDDSEEVPSLDFFQDACAAMLRNACILLKAAGEPVTSCNVLRIINCLPCRIGETDEAWWRESYTNKLLDAAAGRTMDYKLCADLHWYFVIANTRLSYDAHEMREAAFMGILGGIDWDAARREPPEVPVMVPEKTPLKRGWLERWAARRGW